MGNRMDKIKMPNGVYEFPEGQYYVNWDTIEQIIKSYATARLIEKYSGTDKEFEKEGIQILATDWEKVESEKEEKMFNLMIPWLRSEYSILELQAFLRELIQTSRATKKDIQKRRRAMSANSMAKIRSDVKTWDKVIGATKIVRDLSADVVLVGASVATGGMAAAGYAAAGSGMKGFFHWQDNGNVGTALIETTGTFVLTMIPIGTKFTGAREGSDRAAIILLDLQFNVAKEIVDGKSAGEALKVATIKTVSGQALDFGADKIVKSQTFRDRMQKWSIPVSVRHVADPEMARIQFAEGVTKAALTLPGKNYVDSRLSSAPKSKTNFSRGGKPFRYTHQATMNEERLLRKAIRPAKDNLVINL